MYVDIFFDTQPTEAIHPTKLDALYAVKKVVNSKGTYWHAIVTDEQYANRIAKSLPALTWDDAIKSKTKILKKITADAGGQKDCPEHVFGSSVYDPKVKKIVLSSGKADISTASVAPVLK